MCFLTCGNRKAKVAHLESESEHEVSYSDSPAVETGKTADAHVAPAANTSEESIARR